jgi:hypothetical protein
MLKITTASLLVAGALMLGGTGSSEARGMRAVTCPNGQTVQVPDHISNSQACVGNKLSAAPSGGYVEAKGKGHPCRPGAPAKGCRDWINGTKKPPIQPKG